MTQADLLDYVLLEEHNCYVYKTKSNDIGSSYFIRRNGNKKNIAVIYPVKKNGTYTKTAVCHVCNILAIPVPDYGKTMQSIIDDAKETIGKLTSKKEDEN